MQEMNNIENGVILDTNVVSYIFDGRPQSRFFGPYLIGRKRAISFITLAELFHGAKKDRWGEQKLSNLRSHIQKYVLLPFEFDLCLKWAEIKTECERIGQPISDSDCWIAASAMYYDCVLATNNGKHFQQVKGIKLITPNFN